MSIRIILGLLLLPILVSCKSEKKTEPNKETVKPNVVVIMVDDLGYADLGFLPCAPTDVKTVGTPFMDNIAKKGTYFTNAYATAPICSPSRAGFITGKYQQRWGNYWYNEGGLPADQKTIPQALKELGYATKKIGKTHLNGGPVEYPTDHGFDEFLGFMHHTWDYIRLSEKDVEAYRRKGVEYLGNQIIGPLLKDKEKKKISYENSFTTEVFADEAIEYIKRDWGDQPFYLQLEFNAVHQPTYVVPEHYAKQFEIPYVPFDREAEEWGFPYWEPSKESHQDFHEDWGHMRKTYPYGRKAYLAQLKALDDNIGRIYKALEAQNILENTLIVFLSDNGGTINTFSNKAPSNGYKYTFGEGGIRIPVIVSWPTKLPVSQQREKLVSTMDIFPTVMELVEGDTPDVDGKSLVHVINDPSSKTHESICWSKGKDDTWVVRQGDWKLISSKGWVHSDFRLENGLCVKAEDYIYPEGIKLFNLKEDIGESKDLSAKYPDKVKALKGIYKKWSSEMSAPRTSEGKLK